MRQEKRSVRQENNRKQIQKSAPKSVSKPASKSAKKQTRQNMRGRKLKQLSFFNDKIPRLFGGSRFKGHAKCARPLSTKESVHLVLKSKQAIGPRSMLRSYNAKKIDAIIRRQAKLSGIRVYHLVNVGNHLHLVVRITNLNLYDRFIRSVTGLIARHVTNRERGDGRKFLSLAELKLLGGNASGSRQETNSQVDKKLARFWEARPFTRLIAWGRDFQYVKNYMEKNKNQANLRNYFVAWGFDLTGVNDIQYLNTA